MSIRLENISPVIGAEVSGISLADANATQLEEIRQALDERMVLVFRDQKLTRDQHKRVGTFLGTGKLHEHALGNCEDPAVLCVKTDKDSQFTPGDGWHTDVSCDPNPIAASMLYITEMPECGGGDTLFANMNMAYELLSDPIKEMIGKLKAVHDGAFPYKTVYGIDPPADMPYNKTAHPIVTMHPTTGKPLLFVNRGFTTHIEGLSLFESSDILNMLFSHIERTPMVQCRVQWQANTLVMWDNVATQHHAVWDYFPQSRYGERVSSVGQSLLDAAA